MKRRDFLKTGLATAAVIRKPAEADASVVRTAPVATTNVPGGYYTPNRAPLAPNPFLKLPVGSIKPKGWLAHQLTLEVNGLCGRYSEVSEYLKYEKNGWVDPAHSGGWEELSYWLRGYADLGYVTGDPDTIALANKWIRGIIANQQPDGWFGPKEARTSLDGGPDFWPHMPVLSAICSYHEMYNDPKVLPFLTNFFKLQNEQPVSQFGKGWGGYRWGDNLEIIYWLYNRTGDAFLLDLARKAHEGSFNWTSGEPNLHNVNFTQGFREPAQFGLLDKDPKYLKATERLYAQVMGEWGQMAGGGFAGDENCRPGYRDPRQGFETCGIAEYMLSFQILTRLSGNPKWMDRCEDLAFNMLPASLDPEQKSIHYVTSMNAVQLDNAVKGDDFQNGFAMQAYKPGIRDYRCCPHNYGMAWPYYAENLWQATADKGLAATLYAASTVSAKVGDGTTVTIAQETEYPFGDTVQLSVTSPKAVAFPLYLRIPGWCDAATVQVNNKPVVVKAKADSFLVVNRTWKTGDKITLRLPMRIRVRRWTTNQNSVSVDRGALSYSLAIGERWDRYGGTERWPEYAVYAQTPWNYGLILDAVSPAQSFTVLKKTGTVAVNPFTHATVPIELRAKAKKIPNWKTDALDVVSVLQPSPVLSSEPTETVRLIPMGAARLRITSFPTIGTGADAHEWTEPDNTLATASHNSDTIAAMTNALGAMSDPSEPKASNDLVTRRFTWWDHKGTAEWVQCSLPKPKTISSVSVYWFDDSGTGQCRVPQSWRLVYKNGDAADWKPVSSEARYGVARDKYNTAMFAPVTATAFRIEVQLQPGVSGGVLRWRLE
ncbi:MAG: glycoside hydrolase family 127 protein [Armatimonadetes bacterium]|nr:glycoside hydrolase family 127 protein [Armatimonadota bacterium]